MLTILHLDDDPLELRRMRRLLEKKENTQSMLLQMFSVSQVSDFFLYLKELKEIHIVILDIHLNAEQSGISLVSAVRTYHPHAVVLMSSYLDDPRHVLKSLQANADEFLSKKNLQDFSLEKLLTIQSQVLLKKGLLIDHDQKKEMPQVVGRMMELIAARIPRLVQSAIRSVYLLGESGTGKEVVADLFRYFSNEKIPFIKVNCGSISPSLLESELFGFAKGAFTGAHTDKQGLIEAASGGWLFLDEVSCLSSNAQTALLRVLENQELKRIGETACRKINVRFISASHIPLQELVEKGGFRNDLWQRLREAEIILKPLRERPEEIKQLIHFFCQTMPGGPYTMEDTASDVLVQLPWKDGNVRELRNCLRAMTECHRNHVLTPMSIPERVLVSFDQDQRYLHSELNPQKSPHVLHIPFQDDQGKLLTYRKMEQILFQRLMEQMEQRAGKISLSQLSTQLDISRSTLQSKVKELRFCEQNFISSSPS